LETGVLSRLTFSWKRFGLLYPATATILCGAGLFPPKFKKLSFEGDCMKRLITLVFALLLGASLSVAQTGGTGGGTAGSTGTSTTDTGKKGHKGAKKGHKGGKKSKKGSGGSTTPPPK
jgi:hypothetical protein